MENLQALSEIYTEYKSGSQGFCIAVETHCGFNISRDEIERIGDAAGTAEEFYNTWENETWWTDGDGE